MRTRQALRAMAPIAETQRGLVTSAQAARVGVPRLDLSRMAGTGDLERLTHGVYRFAGADTDLHTELYANWLALDPVRTAAERLADRAHLIAASHRSAAEAHGLGNLPAREHHFTASYRKQSQRARVRISLLPLDRDDVSIEHGMLVTTPERTIADLFLTEGDESQVADVLADAMRADRVSSMSVAAALRARGIGDPEATAERLLSHHGLDATSAARTLASAFSPDQIRSMAESTVGALDDTHLMRLWAEQVTAVLKAATPSGDNTTARVAHVLENSQP